MPPTFDLLVIGDANPDVIVGPLTTPLAFGQREQLIDSGALTLGGSAAITACGAARLGLRVAFAGRIGDDGAGHYMRDQLAAQGVDISGLHLDPSLPTPLTVIVTRDDDRAILTAPGTLAATSGRDVPEPLLRLALTRTDLFAYRHENCPPGHALICADQPSITERAGAITRMRGNGSRWIGQRVRFCRSIEQPEPSSSNSRSPR
ncbi:carbohydrate kinase family protein, partial [Streptomyces sp. NPDC059426]|uniref:carbohydrate kinase family protein n=1 Tax=Streptomyces sp. NPDC059426 TaxID=3346827 RepID=UPI0036769996